MTGCFPSEVEKQNNKVIDEINKYMNENPTNYCHTDVNSACYKNHQLLVERIGFVERALDNYREYKTGIEDLGTDVMYLKQRIEKLERLSDTINAHQHGAEEFVKKISNELDQDLSIVIDRIDKLEKENLMRQDTIACMDSAYDESHREIEKRLDELEEMKNDYYSCIKNNAVLEVRIKELELLTNALRDKWNSFCPPALKKEPFTCPVCEGTGLIFLPTSTNNEQVLCQPCEGKGIVFC